MLCEHLEAFERDEIRFLMVFEPPRHSKTYHVSERFPAYYLGRHPRNMVIIASYVQDLAEQSSFRARGILQSELYPFDTKVQTGASAKQRWYTEQGGSLLAAGVGGQINGFGAHALIIDDPMKGRNEANSPVIREQTWNWYTADARPRLMPRSGVIVMHTRWHQDDLAGRILNSTQANDWTVLCLPAIAESDHPLQPSGDPLGRKPGEALWPEWYDERALAQLREGMSSSDWNAIYQQRPVAAEGGMFKRHWWGEWAV